MRAIVKSCAILIALAASTVSQAQKVAIIIDDIGYHLGNGYRVAQLPMPVTMAVIPHTPNARELAEAGKIAGKEVILHLPMSSDSNQPLDKGALTESMPEEDFKEALRLSLAAVPHIQGVNNHMGSRLTQHSEAMQWLMDEIKEMPLYFIDSRTSPKSQAYNIAQQNQIPSLSRDIFLDNSREYKDILIQLEKAVLQSQRTGQAIIIGHPYPQTIDVLERLGPQLARAGIEFVSASELLPQYTTANQVSKIVAIQ